MFLAPDQSSPLTGETGMYDERSDVYDRCVGEQFVFVGRVNGIATATAKHGKIFFARSEEGQKICLYADRYSTPVNLPDGFPDVLSADWLTTRDEVAIGAIVHAVCVPTQGRDPRAVRWCLQSDFEACEQRIKEVQELEETAFASAMGDLRKNPRFVFEPRRSPIRRQLVAV